MKKVLSYVVLLAMFLTMFAACAEQKPATEPSDPLADAAEYLYTMYKDVEPVKYSTDYEVVSVVKIGTDVFNVTWSADAAEENVKIVPGETKTTIDVNTENPEEIVYKLTATVSDAEGNTKTVTFDRRTPAAIIIEEGMSYAEIVDIAYQLETGMALDGTYRLYGTIVSIDTAWSDQYKNITVTIAIEGKEDKPIMCYRLAGEGAADLAVGDKITVEGALKNYNGTIEFDAGCALLGVGAEVKDQSAILDAAYSLEVGMAMTEPCTLTGVISTINTVWSEQYKNITVTIVCGGDEERPMMCYRLAGEGAADLAVGDTITVTGTIKNYNGTIEFDAGCTLDAVVKSEAPAPVAPEDPAEIVDAAYALESGASLPYAATLTGTITEIPTAWSEQYGNITVTIAVAGKEDKPIVCFRLKGDGAADLAVGDAIIVTGIIKNYNGTIEFDSGCTFVPATAPEDPAKIVDAAYALESGASLPYTATLTGVITEIPTAWSEQYGNITVTIAVAGKEDKPIVCFRLKGEGAADLAVGDTITVTGIIKNYNGTIEFDSGCTLDSVTKA